MLFYIQLLCWLIASSLDDAILTIGGFQHGEVMMTKVLLRAGREMTLVVTLVNDASVSVP